MQRVMRASRVPAKLPTATVWGKLWHGAVLATFANMYHLVILKSELYAPGFDPANMAALRRSLDLLVVGGLNHHTIVQDGLPMR